MVLKFSLDEASAKIRTGPPGDDEEDYALDVWSGVLPLRQVAGEFESDPHLNTGISLPGYLNDLAESSQ